MSAKKNETVKIGLIQTSVLEDKKSNLDKALSKIKEAASLGAQIVCLQELFTTQYFPQTKSTKNFELAEEIPCPATKALSETAKENNIILIGGSIFEKIKIQKNFVEYYNTSVIFNNDGIILGKYRKIHIPYDPYFYEKNYFSSGSKYLVLDTSKINFGVLICYDQWFPEAARANALKGAQIIFYPTAIGWFDELRKVEPFSQQRWERDQCSHASANGIYVAAVNRVGKEGKIEFWGNSFVADPFGNVIARAGSTQEEVLVAEIDLNKVAMSQEGWGFLRNRQTETYKELLRR